MGKTKKKKKKTIRKKQINFECNILKEKKQIILKCVATNDVLGSVFECDDAVEESVV